MSVLKPPRYDSPMIDPSSGRLTREWYQYLQGLGNALGSNTLTDDLQVSDAMDSSSEESLALKAQRQAEYALAFALYGSDDVKKPDDNSLLYWWPQ